MKARRLLVAVALCAGMGSSLALTAGDWYKAPDDQKKAEVARVLGNIGAKPGCRVKLSTDYYLRALNAMLVKDTSARRLQFAEALALIGTAAEGDWCPGS